MNNGFLADVADCWSMMLQKDVTDRQVEVMLRAAAGLRLMHEVDDSEEDPEEKTAPEKAPEQKKKQEPKKKKAGRKPLDWGKIGALYRAGWDAAKIADEMNCSVLTIRHWIQEQQRKEMSGADE